jgi:hypothetical protein
MGLAAAGRLRGGNRGGAVRARRVREAGELLELAGLEAGGLGVLADGTLIRALEVGAVNPLLKDEETVAQLSERFHRLLARIPERESLSFYVISQPLDAQGLCEHAQSAPPAKPTRRGVRSGPKRCAGSRSRKRTRCSPTHRACRR